MRWYKHCLFHGQSPLHCEEIQYPVGAPLGNFSPLHFQTLLYVPLSLISSNDVLCYNAIWFFNLCFTGLGTFVLVWYVLRDRASACLGGLLAMLSGPVLLHAHGHVELITLGWLPLFMVGWIRWLNQPSAGRLLLALVLYFLVALSAAYFAVFALVPATICVIWQAARGWHALSLRRACGTSQPRPSKTQGVPPVLPWLASRIGWLSAFAIAAALGLSLIYLPQIFSRHQGYSLSRPKGEFNFYGAPPWSYLMPSYLHGLGRLLPYDLYAQVGSVTVECCSYLGTVTLFLLGYAAFTRCRFERAGMWWSLLLVCMVLSFGAYWRIGSARVSLPAEWLRKAFFVFQALRVPARFNLCASVFAAVPAAAGLRQLLARLPNRALQTALVVTLSVAAVADLAMVPFQTSAVPDTPACYEMLRQRKGGATLVEVPQFGSGTCADLSSACTYWQAWHGCPTTAGYSGYDNVVYDNRVWQPSPFAWPRLGRADYLANPQTVSVDLVCGTSFEDYVWLYLSVHRLDYVVLHQEQGLADDFRQAVGRLKPLLEHARIFEDGDTAVYDRALLRAPQRPTLLCTAGWRYRNLWRGRRTCVLEETGHVAVFNPDPNQLLTFTVEAVALHRPRTVRVLAGDLELARWVIAADDLHSYTSQPFQLPAGLSELIIQSDGEERPERLEITYEGDTSPYSLRVAEVGLREEIRNPKSEPECRAGISDFGFRISDFRSDPCKTAAELLLRVVGQSWLGDYSAIWRFRSPSSLSPTTCCRSCAIRSTVISCPDCGNGWRRSQGVS